MAKPELGTKRLCSHCGAKFYDLNKDPITCPKCGTLFQVVAPTQPRRGMLPPLLRPRHARSAAEETEAAETPNVEFVSLEEADAEAQGKKRTAEDAVDDEVRATT